MAETHETIADIIAWLRKPREGENAYLTLWRDEIADRIKAAHKREIEATAAKCCQLGRLAGYGASEIKHQQESVGDAAKLREACANIAEYARSAQCHTEDAHVLGYLNQIEGWAKAALAALPRNCDVGTAEEQMKRQHDTMCNTTKACPDSDWSCRKCFAEWAQMPYEEGEKKGGNDAD